MIWRDLATWLRAYMLSLYGNIGNVDAVNRRLYEIPTQYGNIFRVFFGDRIAEQLMFLVTQYIATFQSLFTALLDNDAKAVDDYTQRLYQNVETRAELFSTYNPYWRKGELSSILSSFTNLKLQEATAIVKGEYSKDIDIFDRLMSYTTVMGDYISEGILNYLLYAEQPQQIIPETAT